MGKGGIPSWTSTKLPSAGTAGHPCPSRLIWGWRISSHSPGEALPETVSSTELALTDPVDGDTASEGVSAAAVEVPSAREANMVMAATRKDPAPRTNGAS